MAPSDDAEANLRVVVGTRIGNAAACGGDAEAHATHDEGKRARNRDHARCHAALRCVLSFCYQTQPFRSALERAAEAVDSMLDCGWVCCRRGSICDFASDILP